MMPHLFIQMNLHKFFLAALAATQIGVAVRAAEVAPEVKLTSLADRVRVEIGGQLFTEYIFGDAASRPYLYPILAPDGTSLTRNFPMQKVAGEDTDHPWQRALMFAHGNVNGVDFWNEGHGDQGRSPDAKGKQVQSALVEIRNGPVGVLRTQDRWMAPDGKIICTDDRKLSFRASATARMIDFEITLHAPTNGPLVLGDNKDGTMAIRLAQWLTLLHKSPGGEASPGQGHIVTANGKRDAAAWGQRADWCDYYAGHSGKIYGVAIFDHPQNPRHPTWWMARDYGLFAANPFGRHDFEHLPDHPHAGDYRVPTGGSVTLRYRFYFHSGDARAAEIAEHYAEYAAEK